MGKWAYYNEIDPFAAEWIRQLIKTGQITDGEVDERSIEDVTPSDVAGFNRVHWFAGIAGWDYALNIAGWGDRPVWTGSAPCQPFSAAGKGGGTADERHLWPALFWLISQCRPETVFGEQVASKDGLGWWDIVSADLEGAGYACGANDLCAPGVGAFHIRQRLYWVANANSPGRGQEGEFGGLSQIRSRRADKRVPTPGSSSHYGVSTLADAQCSKRRAIAPGRQSEQHGAVGERQAPGGSINGREVSPLAHPESPECECTRGTRTGRAGSTDCVVMGDASGQGLPIAPSNGETPPAASGAAQRQTAERTNSHIARPWDNPIWLPCADGKARPAQSSIFPLVAGLPRGVGYSGDPCPQTAQNTAEGRVMRLKGYGNAIVPQLAAEFVGAAMEVLEDG